MLRRLKGMFDAGVGLLELKAQLAVRSLEQAGVVLMGYLAAGVLLALGALGLLAAAVVLLASEIGAGLALLVVAGGVALIGCIVLAVLIARNTSSRKSRDELEREVTWKQQEFEEAVHGHAEEPKHEHAGPSSALPNALLQALTKDPALIATAGFTVVSFLGLKRTVRLLSAAITTAKLVHSVQSKMQDFQGAAPHEPPRQSRWSAHDSAPSNNRWSEVPVDSSAR